MADVEPGVLVERLRRAVNDHDLDSLTRCFAAGFRNETPAHPARSFQGREQVRRNWEQIFAAVPDLRADVRWIADDHTAWSEWEIRGRRRDRSAHSMRGVVIFGVERGEFVWARFYLEPVEEGGDGVEEAVKRSLTTRGPALECGR